MVAEQRGGSAASLIDALIPLIMEEIVEAVNAVPRERIAQRICEQIVDVDGSQVAEQDTEAPKTSKPRPNLVACSGTDSRCSRAGDGDTVVGSTEDHTPRQNPAADCETGKGNTGSPIRDQWSRRTDVLIVPGKFKCCFADIDRSQRIRIGDIGQTARRAGTLNRA